MKKPKAHWSWQVARIAGIPVRVHATFVILLAWILFSHLSAGHGLSAAAMGLVVVVAMFAVVVLHELGHALVAKRFGVGTSDITLYPVGGVARLDRIPEEPRQELLIALAGPGVNVALAVVAAVVLVAGGQELLPAHLSGHTVVTQLGFVQQLFWINVLLAVFNLLPAFPMDGGRVLRALLAMKMEHGRATEIAARIGQGFALVLGLIGLVTGSMLMFVALFVWIGAGQEASSASLKTTLRGRRVEAAMITEFHTVMPTDRIGRAIELVLATFQTEFPVVDAGRVVGVLTRADIARGLAQGGLDAPVAQAMRSAKETASPADDLGRALGALDRADGAPVLVMKDAALVGMLTPQNVAELMMFDRSARA